MKKVKLFLSFAFMLFAVVAIVGCASSVSANDTYVTLDINPSIELIVTPREKVVYANPLNPDGEVLLEELDLIGLDLDEAVALVIQTATELGYIDVESEDTIVSVTAVSSDPEIGEKIRTQVKEHINNAFKERAMMGRAEDKGYTPEFLAEAETYGVTPGFLRLVNSVVETNDELLLEDALLLTVQELQALLKDAREAHKEVVFALRTEFFEARELLFDEYKPQIEEIEASIVVANEEIAALELELAEADEALKADIQVELDLALENLATLEADLEAVQTLLHDEMAVLRNDFHEQSEVLRAEIKEMFQHRKEINEEKVETFMNQMQERKEQMKEQIESYQNKRP